MSIQIDVLLTGIIECIWMPPLGVKFHDLPFNDTTVLNLNPFLNEYFALIICQIKVMASIPVC